MNDALGSWCYFDCMSLLIVLNIFGFVVMGNTILVMASDSSFLLPQGCPSVQNNSTIMPKFTSNEMFLHFVDSDNGIQTFVYFSKHNRQASVFTIGNDTRQTKFMMFDESFSEIYVQDDWPDNGNCSSIAVNKSASTFATNYPIFQSILDSNFGAKRLNIFNVVLGKHVPVFAIDKIVESQSEDNKTTFWRTCQGTNASDFYDARIYFPENTTETSSVILKVELAFGFQNISNKLVINRPTVYKVLDGLDYVQVRKMRDYFNGPFLNIPDALTNTPDMKSCGGKRSVSKKIPKLPDSVTFTMNEIHYEETSHIIHSSLVAINYNLKAAIEKVIPSESFRPELFAKYGGNLLSVTEFYEQYGMQSSKNEFARYIFDHKTKNCSHETVSDDFFTKNHTLKHGYELLKLNEPGWVYSGVVTVAGQNADRFINAKQANVTYEAYFTYNTSILTSYRMKMNGHDHYIQIVNFRNYNMDFDDMHFPLLSCIRQQFDFQVVVFQLPVAMDILLNVTHLKPIPDKLALAAKIRDIISNATIIHPYDMNNILIKKGTNSRTQVWVIILTDISGQEPTHRTYFVKELQEAVKNRKIVVSGYVASDFEIVDVSTTKSTSTHSSTSTSSTLSSTSSTISSTTEGFHSGCHTTTNKGYANGSMAALGIFMLLLGLGGGFIAAWWKWKSVPANRYQLQSNSIEL